MNNIKKIPYILLGCFAAVVAIVIILTTLFLYAPESENFSSVIDSSISSEEVQIADCPIDFASLQAQNKDICAWISIPGIEIEYPILQSSDDAEDYYLNHDINRKQKTAGSLYIQKINANSFSDKNTVIYGHNMLNGSMFGKLKKYRNKDFFNQNDTIYIYTPNQILTYRIFSAFINDNLNIMYTFNFNDANSYSGFLNTCKNPKSSVKNYRSDIEVTTNDKIITLSTCTSKDSERYLVVAMLVDSKPCK